MTFSNLLISILVKIVAKVQKKLNKGRPALRYCLNVFNVITDRLRGRRRKVGGRRAEVDLEDAYEDYRAPQIQDIPGRIQGLPHDNSK